MKIAFILNFCKCVSISISDDLTLLKINSDVEAVNRQIKSIISNFTINKPTSKNEVKLLSETVNEVLEVPFEVITRTSAVDLNKSLFAVENSLQNYDFKDVC